MDVLVEVHTADEAEIATELGCALVGVNNRNLADFKTDLATSESLLPMLVNARVKVSESALETRADLDLVKAAGCQAVLIGTAFCSADDIEGKVRQVMGR
jgi:indole-3-glycerol phosphate synthase